MTGSVDQSSPDSSTLLTASTNRSSTEVIRSRFTRLILGALSSRRILPLKQSALRRCSESTVRKARRGSLREVSAHTKSPGLKPQGWREAWLANHQQRVRAHFRCRPSATRRQGLQLYQLRGSVPSPPWRPTSNTTRSSNRRINRWPVKSSTDHVTLSRVPHSIPREVSSPPFPRRDPAWSNSAPLTELFEETSLVFNRSFPPSLLCPPRLFAE